jgi:hypothetical protein
MSVVSVCAIYEYSGVRRAHGITDTCPTVVVFFDAEVLIRSFLAAIYKKTMLITGIARAHTYCFLQ